MPPRWVYSTPFFITALFIFIVALFAHKRRQVRGAIYLTLVCLSGGIWATFEGMRYVVSDLKTDMLMTYIQYLGVIPISGLSLLFALSHFGFERWISRRCLTVFFGLSIVMLALVWTDPWHHLLYRKVYMIDTGPLPLRVVERAVLWWVIIGYHYVLMAVVTALLIKIMTTSTQLQRSQATLLVTASSFVWIVNIIYVAGGGPMPDMDISPLAFSLVAMSMAWAFFKYNLLDILPIAKAEIFHELSDPILVLDSNNRILDLNRAAGALLEIKTADVVGRNIGDLAGIHAEIPLQFQDNRKKHICIRKEGCERYFDLSSSTLKDKRGTEIGRIIIFHDSTEQKVVEQARFEQERLQGALEMAGAVSHDLSQPVMAILGYVELILGDIPQKETLTAYAAKLNQQAEKLNNMTVKLMSITKYATKPHQGNQIIDIDKASSVSGVEAD